MQSSAEIKFALLYVCNFIRRRKNTGTDYGCDILLSDKNSKSVFKFKIRQFDVIS